MLLLLGFLSVLRNGFAQDAYASGAQCRCIPSRPCWPLITDWQTLNKTVSGQLIKNEPIAISCYPGPEQNATDCAYVDANYANNTFLQEYPVGYSYPIFEDCPPVNASAGGKPDGKCRLGGAPVYTVNATSAEEVAAGIAFARKHNLRLVIRDTGHDILGRSTGFGSLQVWIRYVRNGITYHETFEQKGSSWNGAAFTIGGGYVWTYVYAEAARRDLIVVGGGTPSVGCIGGWMQGGGHSPATHDYGLGADNVLQAKVVLANGSVVTASPSENEELFFAIRGGGPGTYGVVIETTIKAYPTTSVVAQTLAFAPLDSSDQATFMTAVTDIYQSFPELAEAGWSGYGQWGVDGATSLFANFTTGYTHALENFKKSKAEAEAAFAPTLAKLQAYNGTKLIVFVQYYEVPTYEQFYNQFSGSEPAAGSLGSTSGRFLDTKALTANRTALEETLNTVAGTDRENTVNVVELFGALYGQIAVDGNTKPVSGVNPAWRSMIMHHIVARHWTQDTPQAEIEKITKDIVYRKAGALKKLAPDTGAYMNEANRLDPDWKQDFYGSHYERLNQIKKAYDPDDTFYCPTCVGSDRWKEREDGALCRA